MNEDPTENYKLTMDRNYIDKNEEKIFIHFLLY